MRTGIDGTPLLGARTGVGQYVHGLLSGLSELVDRPDVVLLLQSLRGTLPSDIAELMQRAGWRTGRRFPARLLQHAWARGEAPRIELLSGGLDVFHATNFVLPPSRARSVVTVHDLAFLHHTATVEGQVMAYRSLVPISLRRADQVVAVSHAVAGEIEADFGVERDRLQVIPHGVSPDWFAVSPLEAAEASALGLPERFLLFVGSREPRKNLGTLVQAHRAMREADSGAPPLVLVGPDGWGDRWGGTEPDPRHTVIMGYLPTPTLRRVVATATAVCMPSVYEGFGLPVLEALAAGRPVIASDIAAHREVAGKFAQLLPVHDQDAWSQALAVAAEAGESPNARLARQEHAALFTWSRSAAAHCRTYRLACER